MEPVFFLNQGRVMLLEDVEEGDRAAGVLIRLALEVDAKRWPRAWKQAGLAQTPPPSIEVNYIVPQVVLDVYWNGEQQ